jgi:hypothetical protein
MTSTPFDSLQFILGPLRASGDLLWPLALSDPDDELRLLTVEIRYALGNKAEPALPALIETLNDRIVRVAAVYAVVNFGYRRSHPSC